MPFHHSLFLYPSAASTNALNCIFVTGYLAIWKAFTSNGRSTVLDPNFTCWNIHPSDVRHPVRTQSYAGTGIAQLLELHTNLLTLFMRQIIVFQSLDQHLLRSEKRLQLRAGLFTERVERRRNFKRILADQSFAGFRCCYAIAALFL